MIRSVSPRLAGYTALAGLGLLAALVSGRPELVALAVPFLGVVGLGLLLAAEPKVWVQTRVDRDRVLQGDELELEVEVRAQRLVDRLEVFVPLPHGLVLVDGANPVLVRVDEPRTLRLGLRAERWGGYLIGEVVVRARDPLGLFVYDATFAPAATLRVFPRPEALRSLLRPRETQVSAGDELARRKGEGIEFADVRPFAFGDTTRRVNWRASARSGRLWVNQQHPERNTDVVIFLDSFVEARRAGSGTLDLAVRAACSLAERYLRRRDRVGLVSFGGVLRWLSPGAGLAQQYRVVEALLDTEISLNYAWKAIDVVPAQTLPTHALVIALTPLIDERGVRALFDLRARGIDLAVVELSPAPYVEPGPSETDELARRLWELRRSALRARLQGAGIAVGEWREGVPLAGPLQEVTAFRRHAALARS